MLLRIMMVALGAAVAAACSSTTTAPSGDGAPAPAPTTTASASPDDPPPAEAPALNVTAYTEAEVQELFDARCVGCHDAGNANLDLSAPFTKATVGVPTGGASGGTLCGRGSDFKVRIQPGDRDASLLWHKVKGTQDCGSPMPYTRGIKKLDATELERLGLYIDQLGK